MKHAFFQEIEKFSKLPNVKKVNTTETWTISSDETV